MFLGGDFHTLNWSSLIPEFLATVKFISCLDCGLLPKVSLYNMLAIAKLSYVAAFIPPNRAILDAESRALYLLPKGPWQSIPPGMLKNAKLIGMPAEIRDLTTLSMASRVRVASTTSHIVFAQYLDLLALVGHDEMTVHHYDKVIIHKSLLHNVVDAYHQYVITCDSPPPESLSQAEIHKNIASSHPQFDFLASLTFKLGKTFVAGSFEHLTQHLLDIYLVSSRRLAFACTFNHLRVICNHWCTKSRFGHKNSPCVFGCGHCNDRISHVAICPTFWNLFLSHIGHPPTTPSVENVFLLSENGIALDEDSSLLLIVGIHICFLCFNSCRHGLSLDSRMIAHFVSHVSRKHLGISRFLRPFFRVPSLSV